MKIVRAKYNRFWSLVMHADLDYLQTLHDQYPRDAEWIATQFSRTIDDVFIGRFPKRTHGARLRQTEATLIQHLGPRGYESLTVMDVGASDGSTTLSLLRALRGVAAEVIVFLADKTLYLTEHKRGPIREYRTRDGEAIQVRIGKLAWRLPRPDQRWDFLSRGFVRLYLAQRHFRNEMRSVSRIPLVSPAAATEPSVRLLELDCREFYPALVDRFDVIRASNVLNGSYFDELELQSAVACLYRYLRDGGLLVVSRNPSEEPGVEDGTVWRREGGWFSPLDHFGSGSDMLELVDRAKGFSVQAAASASSGRQPSLT